MKILNLELDTPPFGTWTYNSTTSGIGGKPFPSESEAHHFGKVIIPRIEEAIRKILSEEFKAEYQ